MQRSHAGHATGSCNRYGLVHGGAMLTLAETLASHGTWEGVKDDGKLAMGQEINASLMRPITEGHVNGMATRAPARPHGLELGGRDHRRRRAPVRARARDDRRAPDGAP